MKYLNLIFFTSLALFSCQISENPKSSNIPVYRKSSGNIYYVSNLGSDTNSGLSELEPLETVSKVNSLVLKPGDTVLFECGSTFRGPLNPVSGISSNWVKYGSYGSGSKPKILGSTDILNSPTNWNDNGSNIWVSTIQSENYGVGSLYMNSGSIIGSKKWSEVELQSQGDFYFNMDTSDRRLYFYSTDNPSDFYEDIEVAITDHIIDISNTSYVLFNNLHLTMGSAHGFGGSNTQSLIIKGCDISYIGGGFLYQNSGGENIRYGNGIEFWGSANNNLVDGNKIWEIYDTGVTNQFQDSDNPLNSSSQINIIYMNNILINCGLASFELWNKPEDSVMKDIYFIHNTSINPGHGWGSDRPDKNSYHIASFGNIAKSENLVIKNSIFYSSGPPVDSENHLFFFDEDIDGNYSNYIINNNLWGMIEPRWVVKWNEIQDFSVWKSLNGQSSSGILDLPLFTDFDNGDFTLQANSPGVGSPDIGAIEF